MNIKGRTQMKIIALKYSTMASVLAFFCWSLYYVGLNKALDFSFKEEEDVKLMAVCFQQQGQGQKLQQQQEKKAVRGNFGNGKEVERERGKRG